MQTETPQVPAAGTLAGLIKAVQDMYTNVLRFNARTGRAGFWQATLVGCVVGVIIDAVLGSNKDLSQSVFFFGIALPGYVMYVRRGNDAGLPMIISIVSAPIFFVSLFFRNVLLISGGDYVVWLIVLRVLWFASLFACCFVFFKSSKPTVTAYGEPPQGGYTNQGYRPD